MRHSLNPLQHSIKFQIANELKISIETKRLVIRTIEPEDVYECIRLYGDAEVMEKYGNGIPLNKEQVEARVLMWLKRWQNRDPFGAYAVIDKNTNHFIGVIVVGHSTPGEAEVAYLFHRRFWGQKYGSEAVDAILQSLVPRLMLRNYKLEDKPLKKIVATVRPDNPASEKILTNVGFKKEGEIFKFNHPRHFLGLFANAIRNEYQNFFTRRDLKLAEQRYSQTINEDVDVTDKEMATSVFAARTKNRFK